MFIDVFTKLSFRGLLVLILTLSGTSIFAQEDTISTDGIEFSESVPVTDTSVQVVTPSVQKEQSAANVSTAGAPEADDQTLWAIFIAGFAGGLAALLMPCIFPMLPLTVSFFTKSAENKGSAITKASLYGLFIIVIYVVLGLLVTVFFGADALNDLSTNGYFNFFFFLLLVVFAASFLGAFEITLPASWVNKMDTNSDKGGIAGLFFMAATLALVSFSCTGPIIGTLLVQAATTGALLGPAMGMFGFSLALAIPFALFAMFPKLLSSLPKSGGWLNSVKVVLGFLELALALKFLSNVDLAYHWNWFDREIFLVLWICIFTLMGFYLLGKLKFSHDSPVHYLSIPRLFLAIVVFSFSLYMIPGLWGAPLKSISAFLPPMSTQDFNLYSNGSTSTMLASSGNPDGPRKYADLFEKPAGLNPFFDYDEAVQYAKKVGKPIMIDFTGHACVNCRKMEENVWIEPDVHKRINEDFVLVQLYVDDKAELAEAERFITPEGREVKTIGKKWSHLQASKYKANSQPFYVLLDPTNEKLLTEPQGADFDAASYLSFLDKALNNYKK
ncbi:protein-disulfide reductase DsbD family protein [Desertivirga brevis]|uniref:protein-disulfide reductase DsbD family protein n=1 Tax=Desertivirga brevis TaxID=2810310 RepID=UPI001A9743A7|nr:cytochrome c biogenesis protein CcdA [Pedobacter sp. SYSU D00873]